ncbi:hypothetical protein [Salisediminibacterium beveridgei]|uniref:Uncharacterized protein n=1 Tax=Salisediminibacterium beveridgei TaxID=632773 RepID=A0A1D7QSG2_9BACI|nr:hypothetical protein [Salisediminibacterium beveridgei]AOM81937.1 hypothetical protein BBEV_0544 [Salisediminibacterium beveridgei]
MMDQLQIIQSVSKSQQEQILLTKALIHRVNSLNNSDDTVADMAFIHKRLSKCESHLSEMNYMMHHLISCIECQGSKRTLEDVKNDPMSALLLNPHPE